MATTLSKANHRPVMQITMMSERSHRLLVQFVGKVTLNKLQISTSSVLPSPTGSPGQEAPTLLTDLAIAPTGELIPPERK